MPPTPDQTRAGYHAMWNRAKVTPAAAVAARDVARKIIASRDRYDPVVKATRVPVEFIGPVHNRESSLSFRAHLHCGDPLTARTVHVPRGRPAKGNPPFTWIESAIDALTMPPHRLDQVKSWSVERILYEEEKYNGWGYLGKGNSPYIWAGTSEYHGGKYVADGVYSAAAWDKQLGCAAVMKALAELDPAIAARLANREPVPPPEVRAELPKIAEKSTAKERAARNAGAGAAATGGAGEGAKQTGTVQPDQPFVHPVLTWTLIGVGLAVAVVAGMFAVKKRAAILAKW